MPIRLNLLAEAQAAEDQRRRDPVKRAMWVAALLISLTLVWASSLSLKSMLKKKEVSSVEAQMQALTNSYQKIIDNQKKSADTKIKLTALRQLAANRYLNGTLLNALQQTTAEDVQLVHFRVEQNYVFTEETKPRTNDNRVIPGKPAAFTEKTTLLLDGNDFSANGDQFNKFKEAVGNHPYFLSALGKTNQVALKNLSPPTLSPETGRPCVQFSLECRYPEKTR